MNRGSITPKPQNAVSYQNPSSAARPALSGGSFQSKSALWLFGFLGWSYAPLPMAVNLPVMSATYVVMF